MACKRRNCSAGSTTWPLAKSTRCKRGQDGCGHQSLLEVERRGLPQQQVSREHDTAREWAVVVNGIFDKHLQRQQQQ